ncbi:MAG: PmoA family protein [Planctomycetota bacterium]|nr:PmoA family protein [Planctomycetota bacterium]
MRPPQLPDGFAVKLFAHEPTLHNPCAMCFDQQGRLMVSHGPQYRGPRPETPGDQVLIVIDENDDGVSDRVVVFAEGLNNVQGMAWNGDQLWIANSPELTVVRDTNGDDVADEYIRVYTDLGNLEHALHGLNWAPDGRLYMSKGNSKGHNRPEKDGRVAPYAIRELLGLAHPDGAAEYPESQTFTREDYFTKGKGYHDPADDWGRQGGVLRCDQDGKNLEIVSRGFRNPWDIAMDDEFTWLGTDNDQDLGDKVFSPFMGAHFGWGHAWSYDWFGADHLPTVPASAPLFEGSGTGVLFYTGTQFPRHLQNVFFVNDWGSRRTNVFRSTWSGALRVPLNESAPFEEFAVEHGRSLFRPTDIEMGPDGAIYIASWGNETNVVWQPGQENKVQVNEGRIYKVWYQGNPLPPRTEWFGANRTLPPANWTLDQLIQDLGPKALPVWRINAQNELVRRGDAVRQPIMDALHSDQLPKIQQTWLVWTLGRLPHARAELVQLAMDGKPERVNLRVQALSALAWQTREGHGTQLPECVVAAVRDDNARTRFAAIQAIWQAKDQSKASALVDVAATEADRVIAYVLWNALPDLLPVEERLALLEDRRPGVRRAVLFGLMDQFEISKQDVLRRLEHEQDDETKRWGLQWILGGNRPSPVSNEPSRVESKDQVNFADILSYLDSAENERVRVGLWRMLATKRVQGDDWLQVQQTFEAAMRRTSVGLEERVAAIRALAYDARALPLVLRMWNDPDGTVRAACVEVLKRQDAAPEFLLAQVPASVSRQSQEHVLGVLAAHANDTNRWSISDAWIGFLADAYTRYDDPRLQADVLAVLLACNEAELRTSGANFVTLCHMAKSAAEHADVRVYSLAPRIAAHLGIEVTAIQREPATMEQVMAMAAHGDPQRGERIFFDAQRANCGACHQVGTRGTPFAPSLADIGRRASLVDVVESVLHPSRKIVQGFAITHVTTIDGRVMSGVIKSETDTVIQLFQQDGKTIEVAKDQVDDRTLSDTSVMPANFGLLLAPQELADVVAWLMTQRLVGLPLTATTVAAIAPAAKTIELATSAGRVVVTANGQPLATYNYQDPAIPRPFFANVHVPGGIQVTRNHPPQPDEPSDHADLHPGLFLAFGDMSGHDSWRLEAKVVHDTFVEPPKAAGAQGSFAVRNRYMTKDGSHVLCEEVARYTFLALDGAYRIHWDSTFRSEMNDFDFGDQEEMGLGIRLAAPLRENGGTGTFLNSAGQEGAAGTWGQPADWCLMSGEIGEPVRVMLMAAPYNLRTSWWHNRAYGFSVANLFGREAMKQGAASRIVVKKGESFRLGYGILLRSASEVPFDAGAEYKRYCESVTTDGPAKQ